MEPLTKKQYETLEYLKKYSEVNGYMPTRREISEYFGIATGGAVFGRIQMLVRKGYVEQTRGPRGYKIINTNVN
jgi:SOS-response transcriptional repressor LexA